MRLESMRVTNLGPFNGLHEIRLGNLPTIVGKNDVGKSHLLKALEIFFSDKGLDPMAVNSGALADEPIIIDVSFTALPDKVELEKDVKTSLNEEMLVDAKGSLRVKKRYDRRSPKKATTFLVVNDFEDERFAGLVLLSESELNERLRDCGQEVKKSGSGITNQRRRDQLRSLAKERGERTCERDLEVDPKSNVYREIDKVLPILTLFRSDTALGIGETSFQKEFRAIVDLAAAGTEIERVKEEFVRTIDSALQAEIDKIFEHLKNHTDEIMGLRVVPEFSWQKAVAFDIVGRDNHDVEQSLERRGTGVRRLLMVAFFQYLAEREAVPGASYVFAVEEPENCLHPSLQRDLCESFVQLSNRGFQVVMTSHSPVFAGASPIEDLALVTRAEGKASITQSNPLDAEDIANRVAEELGVEPADQITGYNACIFVEGIHDIQFLKKIASTLKAAGEIPSDFDQARVGFIMCGGADNLRHWINLRALRRLNRHFGGVLDSDRTDELTAVSGRKLNFKKECESEGGKVFILRKREIENYIHDNAIKKSGKPVTKSGPYINMKEEYGENIYKAVDMMTASEILEMDRYIDDGKDRHELKEIVETFLELHHS